MTKIRNNIFLGDEYDAHLGELAKNKITACLNVAYNLNDPIYNPVDFIMIKVGLSDDENNANETIDLAINTLESLVNAKHTVLIHCRAGASRSPFILAKYLAKAENRSFYDCYSDLRKLRDQVLKNSWLEK